MKATVDRDACIGCGYCEMVCPDVFVLDDEGLAKVLVDEVPEEFEVCAQDAMEGCSVNAINLD